jgi:hypothetical protein
MVVRMRTGTFRNDEVAAGVRARFLPLAATLSHAAAVRVARRS